MDMNKKWRFLIALVALVLIFSILSQIGVVRLSPWGRAEDGGGGCQHPALR